MRKPEEEEKMEYKKFYMIFCLKGGLSVELTA